MISMAAEHGLDTLTIPHDGVVCAALMNDAQPTTSKRTVGMQFIGSEIYLDWAIARSFQLKKQMRTIGVIPTDYV